MDGNGNIRKCFIFTSLIIYLKMWRYVMMVCMGGREGGGGVIYSGILTIGGGGFFVCEYLYTSSYEYKPKYKPSYEL
jgi:hypothetical protein